MKTFLDGRVTLHGGDCLSVVKEIADNSIDSCVTDPPYALVSVIQRFGKSPRSETTENMANPYGRTGRGFMGKTWDTGETAFAVEFWTEVLRVLKPGGHVAAFGGTRSYHRLACAIEDAGFEIRDQLAWCYGTGFPKSHDVSKGIDKAAGAERDVVGHVRAGIARASREGGEIVGGAAVEALKQSPITAPATDAARQWGGWGTALKPAWEPICLARKPLSEKTVAANILRWGVGALNIDGCRIHANDESSGGGSKSTRDPQCPIHSVRNVRDHNAQASGSNQAREVADDMQSEMPLRENERAEQSKLDRRFLDRDSDWLSTPEGGQAASVGHCLATSSDSEGIQGASFSGGEVVGTGASTGGERSPHQWREDGQQAGEPDADRLDVARPRAREDRKNDDCAEEGKRDASRCTCRKAATGRWPANLAHDNSPEVLAAFPETGKSTGGTAHATSKFINQGKSGNWASSPIEGPNGFGYGDSGSAARFFYSAKASRADRVLSKHPTVKPVKLMQWLVRLITPPCVTSWQCLYCENEKLSRMQRTVPTKARGAVPMLDSMPTSCSGANEEVPNSCLSDVRQRDGSGEGNEEILFGNVLPSGDEKTPGSMPYLQVSVRSEGRSDVLLPRMRPQVEDDSGDSMQGMRDTFPSGTTESNILQPKMQSGKADASAHSNESRIFVSLDAPSPDGCEVRISDGASIRSSDAHRQELGSERSSSPHQWREDGQQNRESSGDGSEAAQSDSKGSPKTVGMSSLQGSNSSLKCATCGTRLTKITSGGVCLDPFAGTGTTGEAAWREGMSAVLIEREEEYQADIERRMLFARARPKDEPAVRKPKRDCDPGTLDMFPLESDVASQATFGAEQ